MVDRTLTRAQWDILEAIIKLRKSRRPAIEQASGYGKQTIVNALVRLRALGMIETYGHHREATEKGKIVFAIVLGKRAQSRDRAMRRGKYAEKVHHARQARSA